MANIGRNNPCPCGSGRKYKKCCIGKAERKRSAYIGHREKFKGVSLKNGEPWILLESGIWVKADWTFSQTEYQRQSGKKKVVHSIPDKVVPDVTTFIASEYDVLFAIDTNTKEIQGERVSIGAVQEAHMKRTTPTDVELTCWTHMVIPFKNAATGFEEKLAWMKLVEWVSASHWYDGQRRIPIITDHDLDNHAKYNAGELPIIGSFRFAKNIAFFYATSDAGAENVLNMLISRCDSLSGRILEDLQRKGVAFIGNRRLFLKAILPAAMPPA